ncbi:hypothetical protein [Pseudomonas sp. GV071]|uniref:hypothetical protein n=1 Tax=Pseudomonas sp. GV071 TaxID=2135754 RepID=UPI000D387D1F|nr:hypothetical protein [Pseudomonas sp. GV071]PTQ67504.1 hypothetical protein C8K61_115122 [Pseudomonas sp. GV071]
MKTLRPAFTLLLSLFATALLAEGSCPKGYGMNWQGQCLDCSKPFSQAVCAGNGDAAANSATTAPSTDEKIQQATQIINAVDAFSTYMDKHGSDADNSSPAAPEKSDLQRQLEESDRIDAQRRKAELEGAAAATADMADMQDSDWRSRVQDDSKPAKAGDAKKTAAVDCNCHKRVGSCTATIALLKQQKTGVDYRVSSTEQQCSKVSYYIDNTPYITVLNNRNSTTEHSAGLTNVSAKSFEVERCDVCERQ